MKTVPYIFWIRSNRGTDSQQIIRLDASLKRSGIRAELENWCAGFGAWEHGDNVVQYGWAVANKTNLAKLLLYNEMRQARGLQIDALTKNVITVKNYDKWLKKNKKKLAFPFK